MKGNILLTAAIAVERSLALFAPVLYRKLSSARFAVLASIFAYSFAVFDLSVGLSVSSFQRNPGCAAAGCFLNKYFVSYWAGSNMAISFLVIMLALMVVVKLRFLGNKTKPIKLFTGKEANKFKQGNRSSLAIIFISLICLMVPSCVVGFMEMIGVSIFRKLGPFYVIGLLSSGACSSIAPFIVNRDIRDAGKKIRQGASVRLVGTTMQSTTISNNNLSVLSRK
ncbi:hypothetical protein OESDEN_04829 [Oesophagostomum dentatum]|uniref:G-protein coupled receptors family 1 profile domain-containing protein n=1 Tax=Oesophagostomum dentatum TaxID=61180 RepID=A0A0B1THE4_OESDE|nr:hypothetical protein OESDEN_04829 [Oesophagostomum dentatum]